MSVSSDVNNVSVAIGNDLQVCLDEDGDGFSSEYDCDDSDPNINQVRYYLDSDGDGQGSIQDWIYSCEDVEGYVVNSDDCDDSDPLINNLDLDEDGLSTCNGDCDDTDSDVKRKDLQRFG